MGRNVRNFFPPNILFKAPPRFDMRIHFTMWLVLNFSLTSELYLPFKYVLFATTKAAYILKCSIFWKTPSLEANTSFYPAVMHFPREIQFSSQCANKALQYTEQNVTVNRSFMFPVSFPLRTLLLGKENPDYEAQLVVSLHSHQTIFRGHVTHKSPPAFYAKKVKNYRHHKADL